MYSPAAVLNLFNNAILLKQTQRIIQLKGVYFPGKGAYYNGSYYDILRDEASDAQVTLVVPTLIRNDLQANKTVTVNGFITRRVVNNASRIDIQLTVTDLVGQTQNKYSGDELKVAELLQQKAAVGFRDVQSHMMEKIISNTPFKIGVIIGKSAIIDQDIKHQLRESIAFYQLNFYRINLTSAAEIVQMMQKLDGAYDIIVVSRGGGENLDVFNKMGIAEIAIQLRALFVTAIGHKEDVTLLQKVADKAFITPSEFGQFLNDTYNHTTEELENSRAQLVASVKTQLTANYQKEIDNLKMQLTALEQLKSKSIGDMQQIYEEKVTVTNEKLGVLNTQIETYKTQLQSKPAVNWRYIIIAIITGLVIGYLLKSR